MDPMEFLETKDTFRRDVMQRIAHAGREIQRQHDSERANQIASEISKLFRKA
jgi:hypothetical protein